MSRFDHTLEPKGGVRRIEVINGASGRRRWSVDEKARILEETLSPGSVVSEVARRHGLTPQQLFGWRRVARQASAAADGADAAFVPALVEERTPEVAPLQTAPLHRPRGRSGRRTSAIEIELNGALVRVAAEASPKVIAAVLGALKAGP